MTGISCSSMERRRQRMVDEAKKIIDNITAMSLENLSDQQLHSLMMMREIARGIVNNRVDNVTELDVHKELASSIDKMVGSCKNVNNILNKIPCRGMDEEQTHSMSRMKEIVSNIVVKRAKLETTRCRKPPESVQIVHVNGVDAWANSDKANGDDAQATQATGADAEAAEGDMGILETKVGVKGIEVEEIQWRLFENDMDNQTTTDGDALYSRTSSGDWMSSRVDFDALGIPKPPSWSVQLKGDDPTGVKEIQVPRVPAGSLIEGLPLSSYLPEPHKSGFEYLLELIAALKHMISTRETQNGLRSNGSG